MNYKLSLRRDFHKESLTLIDPEALWHAPEGLEYIVQVESGDGWALSHVHTEAMQRRDAIEAARQLFKDNQQRPIPLRVVRICRWTGADGKVLIQEVVRTWIAS